MEFTQPRFNVPPPLRTDEVQPVGPVVHPCEVCGAQQGCIGIGPPAAKDDEQHYFCWECWQLRPEKQYSDQRKIMDAMKEGE